MERIQFKNSRAQKLAGHLYSSNSQAIVIMAHGFASDKTARGRTEFLASALNQSGLDALAFDFSGCGESDDERITVDKQVDDLNAAIAYVKERGYRQIALFGHSLGSLVCLKCYQPDIVTMVLIGALTHPLAYNWTEFMSSEQRKQMEEEGCAAIHKETGSRRTVIVDQQLIKDIEGIDPQEVLARVTCPVLIIHGNHAEDKQELLFLKGSKKAMAYLSSESKLEVIEEASHHFMEHLDSLAELTVDWFTEQMEGERH